MTQQAEQELSLVGGAHNRDAWGRDHERRARFAELRVAGWQSDAPAEQERCNERR